MKTSKRFSRTERAAVQIADYVVVRESAQCIRVEIINQEAIYMTPSGRPTFALSMSVDEAKTLMLSLQRVLEQTA